MRTALVADPDGEVVQLVVVPAGSPDLAKLDIGIAANDLEKSRAFYRTFVGLEELPPVDDPLLGVRRYPFRHGTTTVQLWASGGGKPLNPSLAGIQYVVRDVNAVDALAKRHAVPVETPLGETMPGLRTSVALRPGPGHELLRRDPVETTAQVVVSQRPVQGDAAEGSPVGGGARSTAAGGPRSSTRIGFSASAQT